MKRLLILAALSLLFKLLLGAGMAFTQVTFEIPFKFEVGEKSYPSGKYMVTQKEEGKITLWGEAKGEDIVIPFIKILDQPETPISDPQLIFDMVANFEPSYTEYVTEYVLAEVWFSGKEGFLVLEGERSEYTKSVKGVKAEK
jgi:hypothetical protein